MKQYLPREAEQLLLDPTWTRFACDYRKNPQFWHADARTRDYRGHRVIDDVMALDAVEGATRDLKRTVSALLSGEVVTLDPLREKQIPREGRAPRTICVPTYTRRCLSNLVSRVLAETSRSALPDSVRAYVPGLYDPVPESILDLAEAIRDGKIIYWWKIDFSGFFNCIPHKLIEGALVHHGYSERVVNLVLACARTPIQRRGAGGNWTAIPNTVGAPMGLAESAVLANLVCYDLDKHFQELRSRIVGIRYSDDSIGGTSIYDEAVGAVRYLQGWARQHGIRIKGTSPNTRPETLVHDIRRERIPILGAEVDVDGVVHVPMATIQQKLTEIDRAMDAIELQGDTSVSALSMYAGGQGTDYQDLDDVQESVEAFTSYWSRLNQLEAERFRSVVNRRHRTLSCSTDRLGTVWVVSLGDPVGSGGGGHRPPDSLTLKSETNPMPEPGALRARGNGMGGESETVTTPTPEPGALRAQGDGMVWYGTIDAPSRERRPTTDQTEGSGSVEVHTRTGNTRWSDTDTEVANINGTNDHWDLGSDEDLMGSEAESQASAAGWFDTSHQAGVEQRANRSSERIANLYEQGPSPTRHPEGAIGSQVAVSYPPLLIVNGIATDPDPREPPSDPVFVNDISVVVKHVARGHGGPGFAAFMKVRNQPFGDRMWVQLGYYPTTRKFSATFAALFEICSWFRDTALKVNLEDASIVKHLCQRRRRFHAPDMFGLVLALHDRVRGHNLSVEVAGSVAVSTGEDLHI